MKIGDIVKTSEFVDEIGEIISINHSKYLVKYTDVYDSNGINLINWVDKNDIILDKESDPNYCYYSDLPSPSAYMMSDDSDDDFYNDGDDQSSLDDSLDDY